MATQYPHDETTEPPMRIGSPFHFGLRELQASVYPPGAISSLNQARKKKYNSKPKNQNFLFAPPQRVLHGASETSPRSKISLVLTPGGPVIYLPSGYYQGRSFPGNG